MTLTSSLGFWDIWEDHLTVHHEEPFVQENLRSRNLQVRTEFSESCLRFLFNNISQNILTLVRSALGNFGANAKLTGSLIKKQFIHTWKTLGQHKNA